MYIMHHGTSCERVPKLGVYALVHSISGYPRSKSAVGTLIPGLYRRENTLCRSRALILRHLHVCVCAGVGLGVRARVVCTDSLPILNVQLPFLPIPFHNPGPKPSITWAQFHHFVSRCDRGAPPN